VEVILYIHKFTELVSFSSIHWPRTWTSNKECWLQLCIHLWWNRIPKHTQEKWQKHATTKYNSKHVTAHSAVRSTYRVGCACIQFFLQPPAATLYVLKAVNINTCKMLRTASHIYGIIAIEAIQMTLCWIGNSVQNSFPHWRHPLANQRIINFSIWHVHQWSYLRNTGTWGSCGIVLYICKLGIWL